MCNFKVSVDFVLFKVSKSRPLVVVCVVFFYSDLTIKHFF